MLEPAQLVLLVVLGAWVALDGTSVAQVMVSRPLVSGTLAGWILGAAPVGFLVGGLLEAAHIGGVPAGGTKIAEPGPAAIPAVAAVIGLGDAAGIAIGVALGAAWSLLGGMSMVWQRRVNGILLGRVNEIGMTAGGLSRRHLGCVALDGARGMILVAAGLGVVAVLPASLTEAWTIAGPWTVALLALPGAFGAGALLRRWSPTWGGVGRGAAFFASSLAVGWVLVAAVR